MAENFEIANKNFGGMKVMVFKVNEITPQGKANLPKSIRNRVKLTFKPLQSIFMPFNETHTQKGIAKWMYGNFGQGTYRLLRWRKVNHWSRRFAKFFTIRITDTDLGEYKFEIIKGLGTLRRFSFFRG
ncbi:MAG: hypothetical protein KJ566_00910 [Nanoarchaeota archaeon]|nr:hypothetical protein [Nanoarchaeota archaeon]